MINQHLQKDLLRVTLLILYYIILLLQLLILLFLYNLKILVMFYRSKHHDFASSHHINQLKLVHLNLQTSAFLI